MKKLTILIVLIISTINIQAAPDTGGTWKQMPPTLQGEWGYRCYGIGEHPWVYRTKYTKLLHAYSNRIEGGAEVLYIKKIVVTYNDYDEAWIRITFKNRPGFVMKIRHMKEADALTVFVEKNMSTSAYYFFDVYGADGWRKKK